MSRISRQIEASKSRVTRPAEAETGSRTMIEIVGLVIFTGVLAALICFIPPTIFETTDYVAFYRPHFYFLKEALFEGRLPLWNPYIGLGRPFLADSQTAVFYPPIYLTLFGEKTGVFLLVWFHSCLAAFGMRALSRALEIGKSQTYFVILCFLCSGFLMGRWFIGHLLYAGGLCYIPWLFANAAQDHPWRLRPIVSQSVLMALQLLTGHPQVFWFSTLALVAFVIARNLSWSPRQCAMDLFRALSQLALAGLGALCLSAVMLLPFLELIGEGNRVGSSAQFTNLWSMEWRFFQGFYRKQFDHVALGWENNVFVSPIIVVFGLAGLCRFREQNVRGLIAVAVFALLIALGERSPLFAVFLKWLPGYGLLRIHSRAAMLISFVLICGTGVWLSRPHPHLKAFWPAKIKFSPGYVLWVLALIQLGFLMNAAWLFKKAYWTYDPSAAPDSPLQTIIDTRLRETSLQQPSQPPPRISVPSFISLPLQNTPNTAMLRHYSTFDAYTSLFLRRPWIYLHRVLGLEPPVLDNTYLSDQVYKRGALPYRDMDLVAGFDAATPTGEMFFATNPSPRAFVVYGARIVPDFDMAVTALILRHDIRQSALLESPASVSLPETNSVPSTEVQIRHFDPNHIVVDLDTQQDGLLILAEAWYPGWRAKVDERQVTAIPANAWMRAVSITRGHHIVHVYFHQDYLVLGASISFASLAFVGFVFWRETKLYRGKDESGDRREGDPRQTI